MKEGVLGLLGMAWAATMPRSRSTVMRASTWRRWPIQRIRSSPHVLHPVDFGGDVVGLVDQLRRHRVHQPCAGAHRRLAEDGEDGHSDQEAGDRVGPVPSEGHTDSADQDGEGGEPVGPGVQAVGHQRRRADAPAGV